MARITICDAIEIIPIPKDKITDSVIEKVGIATHTTITIESYNLA